MKTKQTPKQIADEIFDLYTLHGDEDYIGEPVSQVEHMVQAASLAKEEGYDDEVILGAFLHDIGHLCAHGADVLSMDGFGNADHERLGADFLAERGFSPRVRMLVNGHVKAKRYLTFKKPEYLAKLSEASRETLRHQGGVMTAEEARAFEREADADLMIRMRYWDDEAKQENVPVTLLPYLKTAMIRHLEAQMTDPS